MSDAASLYIRRKNADPRRQPTHAGLFQLLDEALSSLVPKKHSPYQLSKGDFPAMAECDGFPAVLKGLPARFDSLFCYRITTWPRLARDIQDTPDTHLWSLPRDADEGEAFKYISGKLNGDMWIPLSTLAPGTLRGRRGFTWWTSTTLPSSKIMCSAHTMGLLNSELGGEVLILRCRAEELKRASPKVPTILDAFFSHIFCAMPERDDPTCGRAISLEEPTNLSLGAEESVIGDLDVATAGIEVHPASLNTETVHQVQAEDVYTSLDTYYESLT